VSFTFFPVTVISYQLWVSWLRRELSQEEKSLALLGRIDFGQEFKKLKKEEDGSKKEEKDKEIVQVWPWQGLVDHLHQAHQELAIILDMINHVRFLKHLHTFICSRFYTRISEDKSFTEAGWLTRWRQAKQ